MYEWLHHSFSTFVKYSILGLEMVGVAILLVYAVRAIWTMFTNKDQCKHLMSEGITTALGFLLGGEVLKTIVAPDWKDIGMTCAILLMRAAVTFLLYWERKHED